MDELKPQLHVVSCSFGKDSTAMLLKMLEIGMQIDVVRFDFEREWQDSGNQPGTKEFRKELKKRLESVYG